MADPMPASDGTFASYQGFPLRSCTFQRSRGWGSTGTVVEVLVSTLPPGLKVEAPKLAEMFKTVVREAPAASASAAPGTTTRPALVPKAFQSFGDLVLKETVRGVTHSVTIGPLFLVRAEEVRKADGSPNGRVRLSLEDVRYFYPRGLLGRWSFNRHRADGSVALDSVKPDGNRYTKGEVARELAGALPGKPGLAAYPKPWDLDSSPQDFPPFARAAVALSGLAGKAGLEDLCLRLDNTVALHAAGEGVLGFAPNGNGANSQEFTRGYALDKNGTARGKAVEPGYPEEFVLVTGGETIATVAIDDWEPVLQFPDGHVRKLDEALVRRLTDDKFGMEWLARFVLQPTAYQHHPDLEPDVAHLFAEQAWILFRLPGVEIESKLEPEAGGRGSLLTGASPSSPIGNGAAVQGAGTVTGPGPNAHLLPIRARAETAGGRRQAPTVEAYSFTTEHVKLRGTPGEQALAAVKREIAELRNVARAPSQIEQLKPGEIQASDVFRGAGDKLASRGVQLADVESALMRVREINQYSRTNGPGFVKQLLDLTRKQLEAEEEIGAEGGRTETFDAALAIFDAEADLREELKKSELGRTDAQLEAALFARESMRQALIARIQPLLIRAEREREDRRKRIETTGTPASSREAFGLVVISNRPVGGGPRLVDAGARVVDAEAGIVRLSRLGGHVSPDGAADASEAVFVPLPVRVTFGVVLRPRVDVPPGGGRVASQATEPNAPVEREASGSAAEALDRAREQEAAYSLAAVIAGAPGGDNVIPAVLSDQESRYVAAFKRTGRGTVEKVPLAAVALDRAAAIEQPNMVELVRLDGSSNRDALDAQAQKLAAERSNVPDVIESTRLLLARPWPVNCDGVVNSVTITMREKDGAPCGFETLITTGSTGAPPVGDQRTAVRPQSSPFHRASAARREGTS